MTNYLAAPGPRRLGTTGIEVGPLAWGMWRFAGAELGLARRLVRTALDQGISLLDTADIYGIDTSGGFGAAETLLGRVLEEDATLRRRFALATKGGIAPGIPYDSSAQYLLSACEASLRRLRTDVIDLYQIHRPDSLTHPAEIAEVLVKLRNAGKIRAAGVSNYSAAQTRALQAFLPFPLATHQPEFSALHIEPLTDGVLEQAMERSMAVLAWSPLGGGRLGGTGSDARSLAVIEALEKIAGRESVARTAVALAWVLAHPSQPVAIIGTQNPARILEAQASLGARLTRADWYDVLTASRQLRLP
jgi:predicted oxidoreductase